MCSRFSGCFLAGLPGCVDTQLRLQDCHVPCAGPYCRSPVIAVLSVGAAALGCGPAG
jgi:hypothetical protein